MGEKQLLPVGRIPAVESPRQQMEICMLPRTETFIRIPVGAGINMMAMEVGRLLLLRNPQVPLRVRIAPHKQDQTLHQRRKFPVMHRHAVVEMRVPANGAVAVEVSVEAVEEAIDLEEVAVV